MPSLQKTSQGGLLNMDDDRISMKGIPLNYVLFNIKQSIRMIRPTVNSGDPNTNRQFIEMVELFEEELEPYIDQMYNDALEEADKTFRGVIIDTLKYDEDAINEDHGDLIALERSKIKYRLLNSLLCRKNLYPPRTFIDVVNPI